MQIETEKNVVVVAKLVFFSYLVTNYTEECSTVVLITSFFWKKIEQQTHGKYSKFVNIF